MFTSIEAVVLFVTIPENATMAASLSSHSGKAESAILYCFISAAYRPVLVEQILLCVLYIGIARWLHSRQR